MQKIMFDDKFGLTDFVLRGRKTQTRRIEFTKDEQNALLRYAKDGFKPFVEDNQIRVCCEHLVFSKPTRYKVSEIVAIAQSYKNAGYKLYPCGGIEDDKIRIYKDDPMIGNIVSKKGWKNKMFVINDIMPNRIRITNVRVQRLQDISDEDVLKEGFEIGSINDNMGNSMSHWEYELIYEDRLGGDTYIRDESAQRAYSYLIDKISGHGTWESNPYVVVYDFELIK